MQLSKRRTHNIFGLAEVQASAAFLKARVSCAQDIYQGSRPFIGVVRLIVIMSALNKMSLTELEELAAKLRHAIARNPETSQKDQLMLEDVKQWIAIRRNDDTLKSEH